MRDSLSPSKCTVLSLHTVDPAYRTVRVWVSARNRSALLKPNRGRHVLASAKKPTQQNGTAASLRRGTGPVTCHRSHALSTRHLAQASAPCARAVLACAPGLSLPLGRTCATGAQMLPPREGTNKVHKRHCGAAQCTHKRTGAQCILQCTQGQSAEAQFLHEQKHRRSGGVQEPRRRPSTAAQRCPSGASHSWAVLAHRRGTCGVPEVGRCSRVGGRRQEFQWGGGGGEGGRVGAEEGGARLGSARERGEEGEEEWSREDVSGKESNKKSKRGRKGEALRIENGDRGETRGGDRAEERVKEEQEGDTEGEKGEENAKEKREEEEGEKGEEDEREEKEEEVKIRIPCNAQIAGQGGSVGGSVAVDFGGKRIGTAVTFGGFAPQPLKVATSLASGSLTFPFPLQRSTP